MELAHHGITVLDLDASTAFFSEVLGLEPGRRIDLDEEFSAGVTGIPGVHISVVFLQGEGFAVELLQYDGAPERTPPRQLPCDAGAAHQALYVDDVDHVVARAAQHRWRPAGAVQPITVGPRSGGRAVYLRDDAGAVVELVQRPARARPGGAAMSAPSDETRGTTIRLDELAARTGTELGRSGWLEITQERVDRFADATGDHQWIHVDPVRAADGPYGGTIAHGYLTLSLLPLLVGEAVTVTGVARRINYGLDRLRFPAPVPVGGRVRAVVTLAGYEPGPAERGDTLRLGVVVEVEGGERPGCVAETLTVLVPEG